MILPPEEGYKEVKETLRKNVGQKHIIVRRFIDKVVKGPDIRAWESEKLSQLAHDMKSCALNSDHMHYKADINSMDTLERIIMRLPPHLQAKWAEESNKLIDAEKETEFSHMASFVERRATVANTVFGKLVRTRWKRTLSLNFDGDLTLTALLLRRLSGSSRVMVYVPQMAHPSASLPFELLR